MTGLRVIIRSLKTGLRKRSILALLPICVAIVSQAHGQASRKPDTLNALPAAGSGRLIDIDKTQIVIPDVKVLTNQGKQVRFYTDLVKGKVVLLSFFYTRCTNVCINQGGNLAKLQAQLGPRLGKDVFFISISMDPKKDTPQKLKAWGRAMGTRPGWTLVSSDTPEMNVMLEAFTGNSPGPKDMHSSLVFIGNDRTGQWMTAEGLWGVETLVKLLGKYTEDVPSK
jgi:protein SCO1/2